MKFAKSVIAYYVSATGNEWSRFFDLIEDALAESLESQDGELWLVHAMLNTIVSHGLSVQDLKANKDAIKAEFDNEGRKKAGEFFTPIIWAEEAHRYLDKYIPNWRTEYNVWEGSCGSGNLVKTAGVSKEHLFMSTLQEDDVRMLKTMPEFDGAHIFQCDFLSDLDYDTVNTDFLNKLDPALKDIIVNDKPLIILMNPPYKSGMANNTDVGKYMISIGLNKPAYDMFYQFCWRVTHFVEMFNLTNTYYCFFGPLQFFTGSSAVIMLKEMEHCFQFIDGMCISAQEFSDTSDSIIWGIGCSLWKSRGGYIEKPYEKLHKDILLDKKFLIGGNAIGCEGKILYEPPREKLSEWVIPKDVAFYKQAPLMTSHLTFKGKQVFEKEAPQSGRLAVNALGTLMVGNILTRSADQSAILSMPTTIQYVDITEENFWRCVASYAFRRTINASWAITKKELSAPNTKVEGYDVWLRNALVSFLCEYKSMFSSLRDVKWNGENYTIRNNFCIISAEEVKTYCHDERILKDLEDNPPTNQFILKQIEESRPYWGTEATQLFDWIKAYMLKSLDYRKTYGYEGSTECWDASFLQLRSGKIWDERLDNDVTKMEVALRDYLRKDMSKFGFVNELEGEEDM